MREARLLSAAAVPVVWIAIDFGVSGMPGVDLAMPGVDLARDADLAAGAALHRRWVLAHKTAGLNGRLAERNLRRNAPACRPEREVSLALVRGGILSEADLRAKGAR
jgi:hypothetical protein